MTSPTPSPDRLEELREQIARILEPWAMAVNGYNSYVKSLQRDARAKADAILALIRAQAERIAEPVAGEVAEVIEVLTKKLHGYRPNDTWREIKVKASYLNSALDLLSRLSASQGSFGAESGWRGIESAPRDGTWFLACATKKGWGASRIVRFAYPDDRLPIHGEGAVWPSAPTHWMPLPPPPAPDGPVSRNGEEG